MHAQTTRLPALQAAHPPTAPVTRGYCSIRRTYSPVPQLMLQLLWWGGVVRKGHKSREQRGQTHLTATKHSNQSNLDKMSRE